MNTDYTERHPSVFDLLDAAGCTPQSAGGGASDWYVRFFDRAGRPVVLAGRCDHHRDRSWYERKAVVDWLTEHSLAPSPEAVQRVRLAQAVTYAGNRAEEARGAVADLSASIAALRADKADPRCVHVWRFDDAPPEFRALSTHGGDEDWLALIPAALADDWFPWMESGGPFGCCDVSEHVLDGGAVVRIGAHA